MDLARSVWIPAVVGWLAAALGIECWDRARPWVAPQVCAPDLGALERHVEGPWVLLLTARELRQVPGVGRTRGRQLTRAFWRAGVDPRPAGAEAWMEALPGIGPVTAGAVARWARERFPLLEQAHDLRASGACWWGLGWGLWPRWGQRSTLGEARAPAACVRTHRPVSQAVHFVPATWPNPPTTP